MSKRRLGISQICWQNLAEGDHESDGDDEDDEDEDRPAVKTQLDGQSRFSSFQSQDLPGKLAGVVVQVIVLEIGSQKLINFDTRRFRASCISPIIISNQRQYYLPACD